MTGSFKDVIHGLPQAGQGGLYPGRGAGQLLHCGGVASPMLSQAAAPPTQQSPEPDTMQHL